MQHHLHPRPQRLNVPGGGAGLAFTQNRRLGHGPQDSRNAGVRPCRWPSPSVIQPKVFLCILTGERSTQVACIRPLLTKHDLVGSVSRKGNGWDNSVMERFFLNLK